MPSGEGKKGGAIGDHTVSRGEEKEIRIHLKEKRGGKQPPFPNGGRKTLLLLLNLNAWGLREKKSVVWESPAIIR